jgi:hypothetical protein
MYALFVLSEAEQVQYRPGKQRSNYARTRRTCLRIFGIGGEAEVGQTGDDFRL